MACPVGLCSAAALAAMRAGLTVFEFDDDDDFTLSKAARLDPNASRAERTVAWMELAFAEILPTLLELGLKSIPLVLALPSPDEHGRRIREHAAQRLSRLRARSGTGSVAVLDHGAISAGRAGVMHALGLAGSLMNNPNTPFVLVGASDSLVDPATVAELDRAGLSLSPRHPDGRIPGEAAVFLLVSAQPRPSRAQLLALEHLEHPDSFVTHQRGQTPAHAHGLTALFERIGQACDRRVCGVFSGQPHGDYWGREFGYAYLRSTGFMPEPLYHRSVGDELGDVGAAAGAVAIMQAIDELHPSPRLHVPARETALVYAVSDLGDLGGCVLGRGHVPTGC